MFLVLFPTKISIPSNKNVFTLSLMNETTGTQMQNLKHKAMTLILRRMFIIGR